MPDKQDRRLVIELRPQTVRLDHITNRIKLQLSDLQHKSKVDILVGSDSTTQKRPPVSNK